MADCTGATVATPVSALGPRSSVLNRTIVVSKKSARRPGLPEVLSSNISSNGQQNGNGQMPTQTENGNGQMLMATPMENGKNHANGSTPTTNSTDTIVKSSNQKPKNIAVPHEKLLTTFARPVALAPKLQQILLEQPQGIDSSSTTTLDARILETANNNQREWNAIMDKLEEDRKMRCQLMTLKLQAADKTCEKARLLFQICDDQGIDLEAILSGRPNVMANLRLRQQAASLLPQPVNGSGGRGGGRCSSAASSTPTTPAEGRGNRSPASGDDLDDCYGGNGTTTKMLAQERDALQAEVHSLEDNYSNLFKLYERIRLNCVGLKETEQQLRTELEEMGEKYASLYGMYTELLGEAQTKLNGAEDELQRQEKAHEDKTLGIRLALKRAQIQLDSLETALKTKAKENEELHRICAELIEARDAAMAVSGTEEIGGFQQQLKDRANFQQQQQNGC